MTTIGLFGGTFDPPHLGHLAVAKAALWTGEVDAVYLLPCWKHAFGKEPVAFHHRVKMCVAMVFEERDIHVCADEGAVRSTSSVEILRFLQQENEGKSFRLILGTDNYWKMDQWQNPKEVIAIAPPLWIERPGQSRIPEKAYPLNNTISSTEVRTAISEGNKANHLLHTKVEKYIEQEGLYK